MRKEQVLPITLALAGFTAIVIGIFQGLVHVAPGYEGTIMTGWGGSLNHEERLLARLGLVGIVGAVGALKVKQLSIVPIAMGGIVLFYAFRAIVHHAQTTQLYSEVQLYGGDTVVFILGAEPFLLIVGGGLLIGSGFYGLNGSVSRIRSPDATPPR